MRFFTSRPGRRWIRLPALLVLWVFIAALILGGVEFALRAVGYGHSTKPFIEVAIDGESYHLLNPRYYDQFFREYRLSDMSVPSDILVRTEKPANTFRVFVFGGSAAYGWWFPDYSISTLLELQLARLYPELRIEVFNVAFHAMSSPVMRRLAEACAELDPDLFVLSMGNNECAGPFGLQSVIGSRNYSKNTMQFIIRCQMALSESRLYQLVRRPVQEAVNKSVSEMRWGVVAPVRTMHDSRLERTYALFEDNLRAMCALGTQAGADVALCTIGYNLRDWPPTISVHRDDLTREESQQWETAYQAGIAQLDAGNWTQALQNFDAALAIDAEYADLHYRRARCLLGAGHPAEALDGFLLAVDWSYSLASANQRVNAVIRQVAETEDSQHVFLADAEQALRSSSPDGIPGANYFYDHVHLTYPATYTTASSIAEALCRHAMADTDGPGGKNFEFHSIEDSRKALGLSDSETARQLQVVLQSIAGNSSPYCADMVKALMSEVEARVATAMPLEEWFAQALSQGTNFWLLRWNFANHLRNVGRHEEALALYEGLVADHPGVWRFWSALTMAHLACGQPEAAIREARSSAITYPMYSAAWGQLATTLSGAPSLAEEAVEAFSKAFELNPINNVFHRELYAGSLATIGRVKEAMEILNEETDENVLTADRKSFIIKRGLENLAQMGDWDAAAREAGVLLGFDPRFENVSRLLDMCGGQAQCAALLDICRQHGISVPPEYQQDQQ